MECNTYLRNIQDLLSDGKTPYERRFGEPFKGPIIPFGSLVEYYPISAEDQSRIHQFGKKVLPGLFLGYALYAGGIWKGDTIVLGESEGSPPSPPQDSYPGAGEARNDFWSMSGNFIYRHHVEPRVKLYSPREESFSIPLKYIDVSRTTRTNLDVMQERRIDDYWNIDGSRDLSDSWTGFTQFTLLEEKPPDGYMWSGVRLTKRQATSRPDHLWPELWRGLARNAKLREKHKWAIEKPKLDNARRLRGIYFIDPEDKEFKETIQKARKKLETPTAPVMPCKTCKKSKHGETRSKTDDFKAKFACILEASECTRMRMEESLPKYHEDHIAWRGYNSLQRYNLVHKFIPMPQAMMTPAAKASVDKEWEKFEMIPAWDITKVRNKSEVIDEARTKCIKVHFASLKDICHLKNAELETKTPKIQSSSCTPRRHCERRLWILCSIYWTRIISISNDSSQSHGYHIQTARVRRTSSWCSICLHPGKNGRCSKKYWKFPNRNVQTFGFIHHDTNGLNHGPVWKTQSFLLRRICTVILWQDCYGKGNMRKSFWSTVARKFPIGNACSYTVKKGYSYLCMWMTSNWLERNKTLIRCGKYSIKKLIWENQHLSLIMYIWDVNQRQCEISKDIVDNYRTMFESRISAGATEKSPCSEDLKISSWSYDMEGHAKKCVERHCELASKTTQQQYKVLTPCLDDHHFKEELKSVGEC